MTWATRSPFALRSGALLLVVLACAGLGMWLWGSERPTPQSEPEVRAAVTKAPAPKLEPASFQAEPAPKAAPEPDQPPPAHLHEPHPLTRQHLKNFRQVDLQHDAWAAIKRGDYMLGRQLVAALRAEYPGEWQDMNEGLEALADCLEKPSPESVAAARRFYDERSASMLRKRVRRYCLERYEAEFSGS